MRTADNRPRYNRDKLRGDLTDRSGRGKRRVAIREVINRDEHEHQLPKDLPSHRA